jgi:hypothetical protein
MRSLIALNLGYLAMSSIAFAAADKSSGGGTPKPTPIATGGNAATAAAATEFVIADNIPLPPPSSGGRGGNTLYPFDKLEVGQSFGVKGKTKKGMASTVSSANNRYLEVVKDAAGKPVMVDGKEVKRATRKFVSGEVDPKTDPVGASVRVWRVAVS